MMLLPCPWCGMRSAGEFRFGGATNPRPDPVTTTPEQWRSYLYLQANPCGWSEESWYHGSGCRRYFTIERDTLSNEVRAVGGQR